MEISKHNQKYFTKSSDDTPVATNKRYVTALTNMIMLPQ
jgi:hypothetical protein